MPPRRDPKTGRLLPGGPPLNPAGARAKGHRTYLRELLGEHAEKAFDLVWQIAQGELTFESLARKPGPNEDAVSASLIPKVTVQPSIRERLDAAQFLIEHTVGKAPAELHVESHSTHTEIKRDYSRLDDAGLAMLEQQLRLAAEAEDAEIVEPKALPSPQEPRS